ncbi:MAG: DUF2860 family protein [Candidatus Polarisedimenticolia bacterium]
MVRTLVVLGPLLAAATPAAALDPPPEKAGWHGFDVMGAGTQKLESNFISGSRLQQFGKEEIGSLVDEPGSVTDPVPFLKGEIGYRFAGSRTYLSAGHSVEDVIRYDFTASIRLTQGLGSAGLLGVELLAGLPVRVWEDPYVTGEEREVTDRESRGARLTWSGIGGSGLEIELTAGRIEVEKERSGRFLGLTDAEQRLLERDGLMQQVRVSYHIRLSKRHGLAPRATLQIQDRDGEAVAHDLAGFEIAYVYAGKRVTVTATAYAESTRYDQEHPIYGKPADSDGIGVSFIALFPSPGKWSAGFTGAAYEKTSDIDFFDESVRSFALVSARRF